MTKNQTFKKIIPISKVIELFDKIHKKEESKIINQQATVLVDLSSTDTISPTASTSTASTTTLTTQTEMTYDFNKVLFKKLQHYDFINEFINDIREYYHESKKYYIDRDINYSQFLTIIRQICKSNNIDLSKKIIYYKNSYEIIYTLTL